MTTRQLPLVHIRWRDAETKHGWESADDAIADADVPICESVGFVLTRDKHKIVLAQTIGGSEINGRITIPKGWIVGEIRKLALVRK